MMEIEFIFPCLVKSRIMNYPIFSIKSASSSKENFKQKLKIECMFPCLVRSRIMIYHTFLNVRDRNKETRMLYQYECKKIVKKIKAIVTHLSFMLS